MTALAVDALAAVRAAGGDVKLVSPKRLKVIAPAPLPDYLVDRLRTAKPELLALLSSITPPTTEIWGEAEEERAAIAEYDGGAPRSWAVALARLDPARPPADVQSKRWVQFIDDCGRFLDEGWADRASALGLGAARPIWLRPRQTVCSHRPRWTAVDAQWPDASRSRRQRGSHRYGQRQQPYFPKMSE
jgi:hypothetical protein